MFPVIGAAAIAMSGLLLAAPPPAGATTGGPATASGPATTYGPYYLQETYGSYRVGAPNLNLYDPVQETLNGREVYLGTTTAAYHYKIHFMADTSKCVAAADNGSTVDIKPCNGADGVVWIAYEGSDKCSAVLDSQEFSGKYLSGDGKGNQFHIEPYKQSGWLQQFRLVDPSTGKVECFGPNMTTRR